MNEAVREEVEKRAEEFASNLDWSKYKYQLPHFSVPRINWKQVLADFALSERQKVMNEILKLGVEVAEEVGGAWHKGHMLNIGLNKFFDRLRAKAAEELKEERRDDSTRGR